MDVQKQTYDLVFYSLWRAPPLKQCFMWTPCVTGENGKDSVSLLNL